MDLLPCACLIIQTGIQPFLQKLCPPNGVVQRVVACEYIKVGIALLMLSRARAVGFSLRTLVNTFKAAALPGCIYTVQNILIQQAYSDLDELTFNLLNQTKLATTALWLRVLDNEDFGTQKIFSLSLLSMSAMFVVVSKTSKKIGPIGDDGGAAVRLRVATDSSEGHLVMKTLYETARGSLCAFSAAMCSGLANCLCQRAMKSKKHNVNMFTLCLSTFSILALTTGAVLSGKPKTAIPVLADVGSAGAVISQAVGGVLVGRVTQHLGAIIKCTCSIASIIVTAVAQPMVHGGEITVAEKIGIAGISLSIVCMR